MKRTGQFEIFKRKLPSATVIARMGFAARARYRSRSELWFGRFRAANGKIQWRTSEGYSRRRDVVKAIKALGVAPTLPFAMLVREGETWILK